MKPVTPRYFTIPAPSSAEPAQTLARRIHLRDGRVCAYCGAANVPLVIDHVRARSHFPATAPPSTVNDPGNLVAACEGCNGAKGPQNLDGFAAMLRGRGVPAKAVTAMKRRVNVCLRRPLPLSFVS